MTSLLPTNSQQPSNGVAVTHLTDCNAEAIVWDRDARMVLPPGAEQRLEILAKAFCPDAIVLESLPMAQFIGPAKRLADRIIVDLHNIESHLIAQEAPPWTWRNFRATRRVRRFAKQIAAIETDVIAQADRIWVCSALDRGRLYKIAGERANIHVVPNGIPRPDAIPPEIPSRRGDADHWPRLLFLGHLGYGPNIEAAHWLIELMPSVWRQLPNARLILAGRNPRSDIIARGRPGWIDVLPNPTDIDSILRYADMAVVPLLRGGGTRIKILEAMAWGLPVIATARAVEGLDLTDGIHFRLADSKAAFLSQIEILGKDQKQFVLQTTAARQFVQAHYGPEVIEDAVKSGLQE